MEERVKRNGNGREGRRGERKEDKRRRSKIKSKECRKNARGEFCEKDDVPDVERSVCNHGMHILFVL